MLVDAKERFAERTAHLMLTLSRDEVERRLEQFDREHILLIVSIAKKIVSPIRK